MSGGHSSVVFHTNIGVGEVGDRAAVGLEMVRGSKKCIELTREEGPSVLEEFTAVR